MTLIQFPFPWRTHRIKRECRVRQEVDSGCVHNHIIIIHQIRPSKRENFIDLPLLNCEIHDQQQLDQRPQRPLVHASPTAEYNVEWSQAARWRSTSPEWRTLRVRAYPRVSQLDELHMNRLINC